MRLHSLENDICEVQDICKYVIILSYGMKVLTFNWRTRSNMSCCCCCCCFGGKKSSNEDIWDNLLSWLHHESWMNPSPKYSPRMKSRVDSALYKMETLLRRVNLELWTPASFVGGQPKPCWKCPIFPKPFGLPPDGTPSAREISKCAGARVMEGFQLSRCILDYFKWPWMDLKANSRDQTHYSFPMHMHLPSLKVTLCCS